MDDGDVLLVDLSGVGCDHMRLFGSLRIADAHIAIVRFKILQQMLHHPLTVEGIVQVKTDWESARAAAGVRGAAGGKGRPESGVVLG